MKRNLLILSIVSLMFLSTSCGQQATKGAQSSLSAEGDIKNVKILTNGLGVKTGCSNGTTTMTNLDKDSVVNVLSKVADWYAIQLPNNSIGFVPQSQCKPIVADGTKPSINPATGQAPATPGTAGNPVSTPTNPGSQTNPNSTSLTADEQEMLNLVNQARTQNNVPALAIDTQLQNMARLKSQDMINNNYFSHSSPTYGSPFDMMKSLGISYVKAGENIAGNQTVQAAHNALMNSAGHKKNILDPDFTHVGIGIKNGGPYGKMFTQDFISRPTK